MTTLSDIMKTDVWRFRDVALGKPVTFNLWDVDPPNPERIVDGDWDNSTGDGVRAIAAANTMFGEIMIDLGAVYNVAIIHKIGPRSDLGGLGWYFYSGWSSDGITWIWHTQASAGSTLAVGEQIVPLRMEFIRARWIGVKLLGRAIDTYRVKIYEIAAVVMI